MKRRSSALTTVIALFYLASMLSCEDCFRNVGKGAAEEVSKSVNSFVTNMPAIIAQIDKLLENNIDGISDALARQIQETNRLLKQQIDGINAALQDTIDNVDAMLAARMQQLFDFARAFLADINDIVAKRIDQLTHNAQELIKALEVSGVELLETAGFQVVRTIREGNKVVAVVVGGVVETVVLVVAGLVMILAVVLGGIFFVRRRRRAQDEDLPLFTWQLGLGSGFFAIVFAVAALMVFVPSVRASVASSRVEVGDSQVCAEILPAAGVFVGRVAGTAPESLSEADRTRATELLAGLFECQVAGTTSQLRADAIDLSNRIQRLLGIDSEWCRRNEECDARQGEHCDAALGLCTTRCTRNQQCPTAMVCHGPDSVGICAAPCTNDASCPLTAMTCTGGGTCEPRGSDGGTDGGGPGGTIRPGFIDHGFLKDVLFNKPIGRCPGPACDPVPIKPGEDVVYPIERVLSPTLRRALELDKRAIDDRFRRPGAIDGRIRGGGR